MPPVVTKSTYLHKPLWDPEPESVHIRDVVQTDSKYLHRTSDLLTGMLYLGYHVRAITKTQACYFKVTFLPHLQLRKWLYQHHGEPFRGPDGWAMTVGGVVFGGIRTTSGEGTSLPSDTTAAPPSQSGRGAILKQLILGRAAALLQMPWHQSEALDISMLSII